MHKQNTSSSPLGQYRQILTTPEHRRAITVARQPVVDDTLEQLARSTKRQSKHHYLFIGPRGIGKSHLLSLIEDGISSDQSLKQSYVVARFPEESHRTLTFADFLLGLCDILQEVLSDEPEWQQLYEDYHLEEDNQRIVDALVPAISKANKAKKRTLLIMLENLNELFTRQIKNKKEIGAFRKFFMDANGCLLIATSPLHFAAITSVDEPFYDFFDVQLLDYLTEEQTIELIRKNLEWENTEKTQILLKTFETDLRPKILALYQMTGGNPRLTVMLYELIAHDSITEVRQQLEVLLDRITPFYQDRLNDLPPQERALLETMARMRDTSKTPAAITKRMRLSQNKTSTLLKRLSDAHYIRSSPNPNDKRSRYYTIREGFFDIWLAMNVSRVARKRLPFLLDFFALFYPSLEERNRKRAELAAKSDPNSVEALGYLSDVGRAEEKRQAKYGLAKTLNTHGKKDDALNTLCESYALEGKENYENYLDDIGNMIECWNLHRNGDLEAYAEKLSQLSEGLNYRTWSETKITFLEEQLSHLNETGARIKIRNRLALILSDLARWDAAEKLLRDALAELENNPSEQWESTLLNNLALLLQDTNRPEEAEPLMRQALEIDQAAFGKEHANVAIRLNNLASLLQKTNRPEEAESLIRQALENNQAAFGKEHPSVATNLNNLASLLQETNRPEEAESLIRQALEINQAAFGKEHPYVATNLNNLALLLQNTNRPKEAESLIRQALEIDQAAFGKVHPKVATDLNNLAQILHEQNRPKEAEPLMRQALKIDQTALGTEHPYVATDLNNLAQLLKDTNRLEEAEPTLRQALEILKAFYSKTGHYHPEYRTIYTNLQCLLKKRHLNEAGIEDELSGFPQPSISTE